MYAGTPKYRAADLESPLSVYLCSLLTLVMPRDATFQSCWELYGGRGFYCQRRIAVMGSMNMQITDTAQVFSGLSPIWSSEARGPPSHIIGRLRANTAVVLPSDVDVISMIKYPNLSAAKAV